MSAIALSVVALYSCKGKDAETTEGTDSTAVEEPIVEDTTANVEDTTTISDSAKDVMVKCPYCGKMGKCGTECCGKVLKCPESKDAKDTKNTETKKVEATKEETIKQKIKKEVLKATDKELTKQLGK